MTKYIQDTLEAIDLKIALLQSTRRNLESAFKDWTIEVEPPPQLISTEPARAKTAALKSFTRANSNGAHVAPRKRGGRTKAMRENSTRALAAAAILAQPFTAIDLGKALRMPSGPAGSYLFRWKQKGWLTKVGTGTYERTGKFPSQNASAPPAPKSAPKWSKGELEQKLEDALKGRDRARETGREEIAEVYQRDIDKLEAAIKSI